MNENYYYDLCKYCEHLYHCYGRDVGQKISNDSVNDMYVHPNKCNDFYPERKG